MSSYSTNLGLELIANGDQDGTWGTTTNTNLGTLIEQAISGYVTYSCTGGTDTITIPNGTTGVARNMFIELTGTGGGTVLVPVNKKLYFIYNNTAAAVTVKVSGLTGVSVPVGAKIILVSNGTDIVVAMNYLASLTLGAALPVASGGTGSTAPTANAVVVGNSGGTGYSSVAPGAVGNALLSNGSSWYSGATTSFVAGMIILWSGSSGSIPTGWLLCDGTSSTPNLRDRFVVGAGSTYAVGATGGSADAITVSHTHTVTDPGHNHTEQGDYPQGNGYNISGGNPATIYQNAVTGTSTTGVTIASSGSSGTNANLPPYYALCYIMKS